MAGRIVNASLLEKCVLATDEDEDRFAETGEYNWDDDVIRERIFDFFPNADWAKMYADYVLNDDVEPEIPDFPVEMLAFVRGRDNYTQVEAIPLSEIPRF